MLAPSDSALDVKTFYENVMPVGILLLDQTEAVWHHIFANEARAAEHDLRVRVGARLKPTRHRLSGREAPNGRARARASRKTANEGR